MPINWLALVGRVLAIARTIPKPQNSKPNPPIIYMPGVLGVKLYDRRHQTYIWGDYSGLLFRKPHHACYAFDGNEDVLATDPLHHFPIIPGLLSSLVSAELFMTLRYALNYREGRDLFFFGHDWRQDYRLVAKRLELEIQRIQADFGTKQPIILIGQSMSNLAIRYLLRTGSQALRNSICKWYAFGPPWRGTYNTLKMLHEGYFPATRRFHGFSPTDIASYPSCYQLLPDFGEFLDSSGQAITDIDIYNAQCWADHRLGPEALTSTQDAREQLQTQLNNGKAFRKIIAGTDPQEQKIPQMWFAGDANWAVRAAIFNDKEILVTEKAIRQHYPALCQYALVRGDDHIPLEHLTQNACGPLIRSYDSAPYGESYVLIGQPKDHRAQINYTPNLKALALDIAAVRTNL